MDELTLDNKKYLSSKHAAKVTGYAKDYVGQLAREGRVEARLVGRNWYVLESSILEHRFGADTVEKIPAASADELERTWQTPRYVAEPLQNVPQIAPKPYIPPEVALQEPVTAAIRQEMAAQELVPEPVEAEIAAQEPKQTLEDMQAAWKEWYEKEERALPDASAMLLADHEEATASYEAPEAQNEPEREEAVPVHIERRAIEPSRMRAISSKESTEVPLHRSYGTETGEGRALNPRMMPKSKKSRGKHRRKSTAIRALILSIAALAVAATIIGSGLLDRYTTGTATTAWTNFLSGTNEVNK